MKVLLVGHGQDYLQQMVVHGFRKLLGVDAVDYPKMDCVYDTFPISERHKTHGQGFGIFYILPDVTIDRTDILAKIQNKVFDLIVISTNPVFNYEIYLTAKNSGYGKNQIVIIDGADHTSIIVSPTECLYFKRERYDELTLPISFSFPQEKICLNEIQKIKVFSDSKPKASKDEILRNIPPSIRDFNYIAVHGTEQDYYKEYQQSCFGITMKKAGWDCQRHYEIIFNRCLPYFLDIEQCPPTIMTNWPKHLLKKVKTIPGIDYNSYTQEFFKSQSQSMYIELLDQMFTYARMHLTTEACASYILSKVG